MIYHFINTLCQSLIDGFNGSSMVHLSCRSKETCRLAIELHWAWHGDNICACICIYQNFWCQFFWSTDHQKVSLRDVLLTRASRAEFCNCLFLFASFSLKWNILKRLRFSSNSPEWIALWCLEERISSSQWKTLRSRPWHPPSTKWTLPLEIIILLFDKRISCDLLIIITCSLVEETNLQIVVLHLLFLLVVLLLLLPPAGQLLPDVLPGGVGGGVGLRHPDSLPLLLNTSSAILSTNNLRPKTIKITISRWNESCSPL